MAARRTEPRGGWRAPPHGCTREAPALESARQNGDLTDVLRATAQRGDDLTARTMTGFTKPVSTAHIRAAACAAILAVAAGCQAAPGMARGEALFDTCSPCHGKDGAGNETLGAPALAGATDVYLASQLSRFREGVRGYHHEDVEGLKMRPMSRALLGEEDLSSIVEFLTSLPIVDPPATREGDAEAGEVDYDALCSNCHGIDGRGVDAVPDAPSLLHLNDWYIHSSMRKYRDGVRGARPGDASGATMRASVVSGWPDERIDNVTAYIATMPRLPRRIPAPPPEPLPPVDVDASILPEGVTAAMVQEGQDIFHGAGICFTCHLREGAGGGLAPSLTDDIWLHIDGDDYESIVQLIIDGVPIPIEAPGPMQPRAGTSITDDQVRAVAAYVYTLSR